MRASGGLEFELTIFTCVSGGAAATCLFSTQMKIHVAIVSVPKVPFEDGVAAVLPYRYTRRSSELQRGRESFDKLSAWVCVTITLPPKNDDCPYRQYLHDQRTLSSLR